MKYGHIVNGTVVNIIVWNGTDPFEVEGGQLVDITDQSVGVNYTYDGTTFTAPPAPPEIDPNAEPND